MTKKEINKLEKIMSITWNTGAAAERARIDLKLKKALKDGAYKRWKKLLKQKAASRKLQAPSFKRHEKDTIIN